MSLTDGEIIELREGIDNILKRQGHDRDLFALFYFSPTSKTLNLIHNSSDHGWILHELEHFLAQAGMVENKRLGKLN